MVAAVTIRKDGRAEIAYVGDTPWHGLGQKLEPGKTIEEWSVAAGMDWRVLRSKVRYYSTATPAVGDYLEIPDRHVLFRSDSKAPLGIVSDQYKIVQPKTVLEFFRDLAELNDFHLEIAGTLFGGQRYWALATIGKDAVIRDAKDKVGGKLLLSTSADGSKETEGRFTTVSVVCWNTMQMALGEKGFTAVSVGHRSKLDEQKMKRELGVAADQWEKFLLITNRLASTKLDRFTADELTLRLMNHELDEEYQSRAVLQSIADRTGSEVKPLSEEAEEKINATRDSRGYKVIMQLFDGAGRGAQLTSRKGTAWGWLNAVTEYVDHAKTARSTDNRLASAWFGGGEKTKDTAAQLVRDAVGV